MGVAERVEAEVVEGVDDSLGVEVEEAERVLVLDEEGLEIERVELLDLLAVLVEVAVAVAVAVEVAVCVGRGG